LPVTLSACDMPKTLPPGVASCLYRVAQEGLRNVSRHAEASKVRLELRGEQDGLTLSIHDDGKGLLPHEGHSQGLGLVSMRERVRLVNGNLRLEGQPGQGTTLCVWVPLGEVKP
jgi:signal transduction histidine kinase